MAIKAVRRFSLLNFWVKARSSQLFKIKISDGLLLLHFDLAF
jgi:hypothetical protein